MTGGCFLEQLPAERVGGSFAPSPAASSRSGSFGFQSGGGTASRGARFSSAAQDSRWGWCLNVRRPEAVSPLKAPLVRCGSEASTLGGPSMLTSEPLIVLRERGELVKTLGPGLHTNSGAFHGVHRVQGDSLNNGRPRGGRHAREGWAGTFPLKAAGVSDGRCICDNRGIGR
eukprot:TRINITY_DN8145_c0_g1_i1.p2 TRINITY_DN8145_c0_g1~~TRINITY_DN8145_c0_g1_i1.p2  ORF type:complete len:172 (+),score=29.75 TRINITY_DN8145_c0_g1_i1:634-1149(+)